MPLAALLLLVAGAEPGPALMAAFAGDLELTLADDNGPPPGSQYPPPPPLVQDPQHWQTAPPQQAPPPNPQAPYPQAPPPQQPYSLAPVPVAPFPTPVTSVPDVGGRLMFGIGLHTGGAEDLFDDTSPVGIGVGLYLRLGYGFNDTWGFEAEVSAATLIFLDYVRQALTLDLTPVDWFTFAFGPVLREDVDTLQNCGCDSACTTAITESVGGTVRADFHLGGDRTANGRSAFTMGLVGDVGAVVGSNLFLGNPGAAYGVYLTIGYARY